MSQGLGSGKWAAHGLSVFGEITLSQNFCVNSVAFA